MEELDDLLLKLDSTQISSNTPFNSINEKEKYESNLMFIWRRSESAKYYIENISRYINEEQNALLNNSKLNNIFSENKRSSMKLSSTISKLDEKYSNEFIAFLSAIRSGLDFMSKFMIRHLKGIKGDSLRTLLKLSRNNNGNNKILSIIEENREWLLFIREYRDKLIHNFNHVYYIGSTQKLENGVIDKLVYPVIVSKNIPEFELDSRKSRALNNIENKYDIFESKSEIILPDKTIYERNRDIKPANGYIEIREFMNFQYEKYNCIFSRLLSVLEKINFEIIEVKS